MKELERTERISVSAVLFLLIVVIGVLMFERPQYVLIDTRNNFEYAKGHLDDALNVSPHQVFNSESKKLFQQLKDDGKTVVLYGENADAASNAWLLLYQLGYENIKILCIETDYVDNKFHIKEISIEKPSVNYAQVIREAKAKNAAQQLNASKVEVKKPVAPKKVITKPKKKKRVPEGGC